MQAQDPDVEKLLALVKAAGKPSFDQMSPAEARVAYLAGRDFLQSPAEEVASSVDLAIDGPGGRLPLRIYRGAGTTAAAQLPCILYLHGGGWVIGDLDSHDRLCRRLANRAAACVVAVDYRLAPEHPFPAALDDAVAALRWLVRADNGLVIDRTRIAAAGDSAGGTLAAVLALMGRDGSAPPVMFQALLYPATDLTCASDSYRRYTEGVTLTAGVMHWFIDHYVPPGVARDDWRLSPLLVSSTVGAPPALVVTVGLDPLSDEGRAYAHKLENDGVRVLALHLSDQLHGLAMQGRQVRAGDTMVDMVGVALHAALRNNPPIAAG